MVAARQPRLSLADKEDLSDLKLVLSAAEGNVRAALAGEEAGGELAQALVNSEHQLRQALAVISRLRLKFAPDDDADCGADAAAKDPA